MGHISAVRKAYLDKTAVHRNALRRKNRALDIEKTRKEYRDYFWKAKRTLYTYRYINEDTGQTVYVGSGYKQRFYAHKRKPWWNDKLKLIFVEQPSRAHARRDEYQWIIDYNPIYNFDGKHKSETAITYRYEDTNGSVLYVGSGIAQRLIWHKYASFWWSSDLIVTVVEHSTTAHARVLEFQWMIDYLPPYNVFETMGLEKLS